MNIQTSAQPSTELVAVNALVPAEVFAPGGVEAIINSVVDKVRAIETDISTPAGRKAIASLAYKVARSKTALDEMGKTLVSQIKAQANLIDADRRTIRERLDELQDEVRKPLTDWENAEKERVAEHELALDGILEHPQWGPTETAVDISKRLQYLENYPPRDWQEFSARAAKALASEIDRGRGFLAAAEKREAEAAETERLRREQAEREQRERDERIAREATERGRAEAERLVREEADRVAAAAEQERQRVERAAQAAAEEARQAAERAEAERARIDRERQEAVARAAQAEAERIASEERARQQAEQAARQAEAARIEAAAQAERDRVAAVEAERRRVAAAQAAEVVEAALREANKRHRAKINNAARDALVAAGLTAEQAVVAVTAIAKGDVPNVKISY